MPEKGKSGVKKQKRRKRCIFPIFKFVLLLILAVLAVRYLKSTDILDGMGLPFDEKENTTYGETKEVAFLNLANYSKRNVTDEQSAKQALIDMQEDIGFKSIDEFAVPLVSVTDTYTFYRFDQLYQGIPVVENSIILTVGANGDIRNVTGNYSNPQELSIDEVKQSYEKSIKVSAKEDAEYLFFDGKKKKYSFSYKEENAGFLDGKDFYCFELNKEGEIVEEVKENSEQWYKVTKNGKKGDYYLLRNELTNETKLYEGEHLITDRPKYAFVHNAKAFDEADLNGENKDAMSANLIIQDIYDFYQTVLSRDGYDGKGNGLDTILYVKGNGTG